MYLKIDELCNVCHVYNTMNYIQSIYRISEGYLIDTIDKQGFPSQLLITYAEYPYYNIFGRSSYGKNYVRQQQVQIPEEFTQHKIIEQDFSSSTREYILSLSNNSRIVFGLDISTRYVGDGENKWDEYDDNSRLSQYLKNYTGPYYRVWISNLCHLSKDYPDLSEVYPHVFHDGMYMQSDPPQAVYIVNQQYLNDSINVFSRKLSAIVKDGYPQLTKFP